ncbi:MAG: ribosomal protein S18-alanine N-acetyltransferase [Actinomycetota bacterium]
MSAVMHRHADMPLPQLEITRMRRRHLKKVLAIESSVYPRPWSLSLFMSEIGQKNTRSYIVAKLDNEVVGYAGMMFTGFEAHVTNIAVDPDHHGRKIGTKLLLTIITEAIARGAEIISLEVRVTNSAAQQMYAKFGFDVVGVRKGYYIETKEDAYVMEVARANSTGYRERLMGIRRELDELEGRRP